MVDHPTKGHSLRWRILIWMTLVAIGPLVIMAVQGYHCARQAIVSSEEGHLQAVLELRKGRIKSWLARIESEFRFLEVSPCVRGICGGERADPAASCGDACNLFADLQTGAPFYTYLASYDESWRTIASSNGATACHVDSAAPAEPFRRQLGTGSGLRWLPPAADPEGRLIMPVGCRVRDRGGGRTAFIAGAVDVSRILDPVISDRSGLGRTGRAYLLSASGRYPAGPPAPYPAVPGSVERYRNAQGEQVLGVSTNLPDLAGVLVVEIDESEAFAWLDTLRARALVTGLATLVLVLLIAIRGAGLLARPLRGLAGVARSIAGGHREERAPFDGSQEAREVAGAFNHMLDELEAAQRRLLRTASLAAVGELSSSIVHEMRNPLSSIKMNLQALEKRVADDRRYAELASIASQQVTRLERMLSELLGYGRPLELQLEPLEFAEVVSEARELVRPAGERRGVEIELRDFAEGRRFAGDREQIRRALTNLMTNAVREARTRVTLSAEALDHGIRISVDDDGEGIAEARMGELFQPFFTTRPEGTGLGLAIVKKIAEVHGGSVDACNLPPGGARFGISLPWEGPGDEPHPGD